MGLFHFCKGADRKRTCTLKFWRHSTKGESLIRDICQITQMLSDQNFLTQQSRVDWSCVAACIVNVHRVDANEFGAALFQVDCGIFGKERVVFVIFVAGPIFIPASMDQHRASTKFFVFESFCCDSQSLAMIYADNNTFEVGKAFECYFG